MITVRGQLRGQAGDSFAGHSVAVAFARRLEIGDGEPAVTQPVELRSEVAASGAFVAALPAEGALVGPVAFRVHAPDGGVLASREAELAELARGVTIEVRPRPGVEPPAADPEARPRRLSGLVIDAAGKSAVAGVQVVLWARAPEGEGPTPVFVSRTDAHGHFFGEAPPGRWTEVAAEVATPGRPRLAVALDPDGRIPARLLLVVPEVAAPAGGARPAPCPCADERVPRAPDAADLVAASETYSADVGGRCVDFTVPNRTLEEFHSTLIVRTTDPEIQGLTLDEEVADRVPPDRLARIREWLELLSPRRPTRAALADAPTPAAAPAGKAPPVSARALREAIAEGGDADPETLALATRRTVGRELRSLVAAGAGRPAGRATLGAANPLDWDDEPTFYQATTVAHGHLLRFRQVWKADGYSLGDLLYSLPLAPGQRKQIAIVDWERREVAERGEVLLESERLAASLSRDRDVQEIASATLDEELRGRSIASSLGLGAGLGRSGSSEAGEQVLGVAGGLGVGASGAAQSASRELAASTLQRLRDRTLQAAGAVRSQRATVVQTFAQGETTRVATEVVANYNHCHALTVEYFEVLRHFVVEQELAAVHECLFVPLLMSRFTAAKALRWRGALAAQLADRRLAGGFDALDRIRHDYEGSDLPAGRYADETLESLDGELRVEGACARPADREDGGFEPTAWPLLEPFLRPLGGAQQVFHRFLDGRPPAERDRIWQREVVPFVLEAAVAALRFDLERNAGAADARLDATLVSRAPAASLYVSLRPTSGLGPLGTRAQVEALTIRLASTLTPEGQPLPPPPQLHLVVRSGTVRYRTAHRRGVLFRDRRIANDLAGQDGVRIETPLDREELRNPREEDQELARRLLAHLDEGLERYHRVIWLAMDPARRLMLLDGVLAPHGGGRSVAAAVENRVVAVVGNCLVMPVAPGVRLDPTIARGGGELIELYRPAQPLAPARISVPTRGVFAEAVLGACNACEKIDETRFWRWEESPLPDQPTAIEPVSAGSRGVAAPDLAPTPFPTPIVNLQNAPAAPDPSGLGAALGLLGTASFRDVTGLAGNQQAALTALTSSLDAAKAFGGKAADLALQKALARDADKFLEVVDEARRRRLIDDTESHKVTGRMLQGFAGGGAGERSPVAVSEFREVLATAGSSGVGGSFDPGSGQLTVTPQRLPAPAAGGGGPPAPGTSAPVPASPEQQRLEALNPPNVRAFRPEIHDSTGLLTLRAEPVPGHLPTWDIEPAPLTAPQLGERLAFAGSNVGEMVELQAVKAGLAAVRLRYVAQGTGAAGPPPADLRLVVAVPQHVVIEADPTDFVTAMTGYGLDPVADRRAFFARFEVWLRVLTRPINVRFLWRIPDFRFDDVPAHLDDPDPTRRHYVKLKLRAFFPDFEPGQILGATYPREEDPLRFPASELELLGNDHEYVEVYLASLAPASAFVPREVTNFAQRLADGDPEALRAKSIMIELVARRFACTSAHELVHLVDHEPETDFFAFHQVPAGGPLFEDGYLDVYADSDLLGVFGFALTTGFEAFVLMPMDRPADPLQWGDKREPKARLTAPTLREVSKVLSIEPPDLETYDRLRAVATERLQFVNQGPPPVVG